LAVKSGSADAAVPGKDGDDLPLHGLERKGIVYLSAVLAVHEPLGGFGGDDQIGDHLYLAEGRPEREVGRLEHLERLPLGYGAEDGGGHRIEQAPGKRMGGQ
jgi:hypothetical protein